MAWEWCSQIRRDLATLLWGQIACFGRRWHGGVRNPWVLALAAMLLEASAGGVGAGWGVGGPGVGVWIGCLVDRDVCRECPVCA